MLLMELIILCALFFLICYAGTGTDEKNLKSFRSYPDGVQSMLKADPRLKDKIKVSSPAAVFLSGIVTYGLVLFLFGIPLRQPSFMGNFLNILLLGEGLNAFDFFVIDLMWFRNSRRTRFEGTKEESRLYRDPKNHFAAFLRAIPLFVITALIDGILLTLF